MNRRLSLLFFASVVIAACAAAAIPKPKPLPSSGDAGSDASDAAFDAEPPLEALDASALAESIAPGMRPLLRRRVQGDAGTESLVADADRCYRVVVVSHDVVDVAARDDKGHVLTSARGRTAVLGPRGPFCLRKGEHAVIDVRGDGELFVFSP